MENLQLAVGLSLLNLLLAVRPPDQAMEQVAAIASMDEKNAGYDLGDWRYLAVPSTGGAYQHRFYHLPSTRPGAPVLLLLHGANLDGRTFLRFAALRDTWELIAYDFPESSPMYRGQVDDFGALLDDFLAVRGIERVWLGGVSFGGVVALRFAATHPAAQVPALLLISSPLMGYDDLERSSYRDMHRWLRSQPDHHVYWFMDQLLSLYRSRLDEPSRQALAPVMRIKQIAFYRQLMAALRTHRGVPDARAVQVPVLVIKGDADALVPDVQLRRFARHIPQAETQNVAGGTHSMAFLQGDEVARRVRDFCRRRGVLPGS